MSAMSVIEPMNVTLNDGASAVVRNAQESDAADLVIYRKRVLGETAFLATEPGDVADSVEEQSAFVHKATDDPAALFLVVLEDQQVRGLLNFRAERRRKLKHRGGFGMTVLKAHWGRGIGTALVRTLLEWAQRHPEIEKVCLSVFATNDRAIALYRKFGFEQEGRLRRSFRFDPSHYDDEILMGRFVKPGT